MRIGSIQKFKYILIKLLRTNKNSVFRVSAIHDTKLRTGLWLNFSHVNELKCRHNLNYYTINPIFGHVGTWLDQKIKVNLEIFDVIDWTANLQQTIHILPNISRKSRQSGNSKTIR